MNRVHAFLSTFTFVLLFALSAGAEDGPIAIGWIGPLTGPAAVLGVDSVEAARLAVDEANEAGGINGRAVKLIAEDDQYDTAKSITAYSKLVNDGVIGVLTSTYGSTFALTERTKRDGVILINTLDCNEDIAALSENVFCVATQSESIARALMEEIRARKEAPAVILYDETNPFNVLVHRTFEQEGKDVIGLSLPVIPDSADFRAMLLRAKGAKPKSLVLFGYDQFAKAVVEAKNLKMDVQLYALGTILSPSYQKVAGAALNNTLFAFWEAPRGAVLKEFLAKYKAMTGREPTLELASIPTYDSAKLLLRAAALSGETITADSLRENLWNVKDY